MVFTNYGKQALTWAVGSDLQNNNISYCAIGSGSGTVAAADVTLVSEITRTTLTGSPNFDTTQKVTFQADFNSVQMSGISLTEFGFMASGAALTGSLWQREGFGSIIFDGTNELQILSTIEVI